MQQYFDVERGSGTLTIFHTEDRVSFEVEHYGGFSVQVTDLLTILDRPEEQFEVTENLSDRYPDLAEQHPAMYPDKDESRGWLTHTDTGALRVHINGSLDEITVELTPEQADTLQDSCTVDSVERYSDGQYPVESVSRDGVRERAEHTDS